MMYMHYTLCAIMHVVLSVVFTFAAPFLALFKQPPRWNIQVHRDGAWIPDWLACVAYEWWCRAIIWRRELIMAMAYDWMAIPVQAIMTKQDGDIAVFSGRFGRIYQLWAIDCYDHHDDTKCYVFRCANNKKWCKWFVLSMEFGWRMPQTVNGGAFVFRFNPFVKG